MWNLFSPADKKSSKVWRDQGRRSGEHIDCVGQQHSWLSAKAGDKSLMKPLRGFWRHEIGSKYSQVIGEAPEKTANGVANPEDGVDQHGLVVFLTHPVVLKKDGVTKMLKIVVSQFEVHLTGDGVEDIAMVKIPTLVAQLVRTSLHQAYHVVPENNFVSWWESKSKRCFSSSPDGCELVWICVLHLEGGEVGGWEVPELCLDRARVEHVAGAWVAFLPWHPGQNLLPRGSCSSLFGIYHLVGATMSRRVEDEHLVQDYSLLISDEKVLMDNMINTWV